MIFILLLLVLNISLYASSTELYFSEENSSYIDKKIRTFAKEHNYTIELKKENVIEVYFDTPELTLSTQNEFLKYQLESEALAPNKTRLKPSVPKSKKVKKAYKESVLYLTKDKTLLTYPVKHYNTIKSTEEKHPLLSLIKRANREDFMTKLKENGTEHPLTLKYLFKISKFTHNYQLLNNKNKISIVVNKIGFKPFDIEQDITTIEIITPKKITKELNLTKIKTNPYIFYLNSIKKDNPYFIVQVKYPHLIKLLNAVFISLFLILFLILFFYIFSTLFFMNFSKKNPLI